jgi:hypothetical protein
LTTLSPCKESTGSIMGSCCSAPAEELPSATEDELNKLRERGHLPCLATPSSDFEGKNQCQTVYVAAYENGTELTFLFLDEDRPNVCEDFLYDNIRRPLFGRFSDIESVIIINDKVEFPGTYSAEQKWTEKIPHHNEATLDISVFEKKDNADPIFWVNTWNHLLGEKNNNTAMEITFQRPQKAGGVESLENMDFVLRKGSRNDVDARFKGCLTSVAAVMTPEREAKLGKRLF